jgi:hypothetical protein
MSVIETAMLMLRDLPEIATEWEQLDEGERIAWSLDWSNEMAGLERVNRELHSGLLVGPVLDRYLEIEARLVRDRPTLERLSLYVPRWLSENEPSM